MSNHENSEVSQLLGISWPLNRHHKNGKFAELSNGKTYYELTGPEKGSPIVLIHGVGFWSFIWDDLVDHLVALGFRVLTYDHYARGHSSPAKAGSIYSVDLYVRQLSELLQQVLPEQKVHVVGFSLGGGIAATFASIHPERVNKLVLLAPAGAGSSLPWSASLLSLPWIGWAIFSVIGKKFLLHHQEQNQLRDEFHKYDTIPKALVTEYMKLGRWQVENKEGFLESFHSVFVNFDLNTLYLRWSSIPKTIRVLLLWGDKDALTAYGNHQNVLKSIPHADFVTIPETGHFMTIEEKQRTFALLSDFFAAA